jgi:hypothetical protein
MANGEIRTYNLLISDAKNVPRPVSWYDVQGPIHNFGHMVQNALGVEQTPLFAVFWPKSAWKNAFQWRLPLPPAKYGHGVTFIAISDLREG